MKILLKCLLMMFASSTFATAHSPVGNWIGFYEDTDIPGAKINVSIDKNGVLNAYYEELYPKKSGEIIPSTCIDCPGSFKNKSLKNLPMLWGLKPDDDGKWVDGHSFSLERNGIYDATAWLSADGNTLYVKGSVGFLSKTLELQRDTSG